VNREKLGRGGAPTNKQHFFLKFTHNYILSPLSSLLSLSLYKPSTLNTHTNTHKHTNTHEHTHEYTTDTNTDTNRHEHRHEKETKIGQTKKKEKKKKRKLTLCVDGFRSLSLQFV
jgi:hypothetical protein